MDERSLLLCLCRHEPGDEVRRHLSAGAAVDWQLVHDLAQRHDLLPLLHDGLNSSGLLDSGACPPTFLSGLEGRRYATAMTNALFAEERDKISTELESRQIPVMLLKGAVLAERVYDDVSLRPFTDLDLVIHPEHRQDLKQILQAMGYRHLEREKKEEDYYIRTLQPSSGRLLRFWIDVHHQMDTNMRRRGRRFPFEEIWRDSQPWLSECCRHPCWEDILCHVATHASLDSYPRFILICDTDAIVRKREDLDWDRAVDKAQRYHAATDLWIALHLAQSLMDAPVPAAVLDRLRPGAIRQLVIERFLNERTILDKRAGTRSRYLFRLATTDRLTDLPDMLLRAMALAWRAR